MSQLKKRAQAIADRLGKLSKERKVPYPKLLTEFLIERLVMRLLSSPELADRLVFKGGYTFWLCWILSLIAFSWPTKIRI